MKHLDVKRLKKCSSNTAIGEVSYFLDDVHRNSMNQVPWVEYQYLPGVQFVMAHGTDCIFLKYYVNEKFIRAANGTPNSSVYQDTCVEFFISFGEDTSYYNFEFNCIGTTLIGYGENKSDRTLLADRQVGQVKYQAVINNDQPGNDVNWELTVVIPFSVFCYHELHSVTGKKCRANFYKCGDQLPIPHFISWSNITWPEPNFHLPEFFGSLQFV